MILPPCTLIRSCRLIDIRGFLPPCTFIRRLFQTPSGFGQVFRLVIFYLSVFVFQDSCCDEYIEQLIPQTTPIGKIKVKVFGHSGVGKTTLIESLRSGYFSGLFRRSKSKTSTVIGSANGKFLFAYFTWLLFLLFSLIVWCTFVLMWY